jgi:hypothetical protein
MSVYAGTRREVIIGREVWMCGSFGRLVGAIELRSQVATFSEGVERFWEVLCRQLDIYTIVQNIPYDD